MINEKGQFVPRDFTGHRQGNITCLSSTGKKASGGYYIWLCRCDCGNEIEVTSRRLFNKPGIQSCGCLKSINKGQYQQKDLLGIRCGNLVAIRNTNESNKHGYYLWEFQCDCGNKKIMSSQCVYKGTVGTKSCGCIKRGRKPVEQQVQNYLYTHKKNSAKSRGLEFSISREFLYKNFKSPCHYCGCESINKATLNYLDKKELLYTGIDRKDASLGYTEENCVPCCKHCNVAKSTQSYEEFLIWIKKVYFNLNL